MIGDSTICSYNKQTRSKEKTGPWRPTPPEFLLAGIRSDEPSKEECLPKPDSKRITKGHSYIKYAIDGENSPLLLNLEIIKEIRPLRVLAKLEKIAPSLV